MHLHQLSIYLSTPIVHMTCLLLLSVLLGGLIGWDRERHERPAGLRTHILVCVGSTLITIVSNSSADNGGRIAAQIVSGVGFLGAGTIMREANGGIIRGLTTAASLWAVAGIGIAIGYDSIYVPLAVVATVIVWGTLVILNSLEFNLDKMRKRRMLTIVVEHNSNSLDALSNVLESLRSLNVRTQDIRFEQIKDGQVVHANVTLGKGSNRDNIISHLSQNKNIVHVQWGQ